MSEADGRRRMNGSVDNDIELRAWQLERRDVDRIIYYFIKHSTIERFRPFIAELGPPVSEAELGVLGRKFRPWVRAWVTNKVPDRYYESEFQKHLRTARKMIVGMLGKRRSAALLSWAKYCWPYYTRFPGEGTWDGLLYHLFYFGKTHAKVPPQLFRGRSLRARIEELYTKFEREKTDFQKRLKRHLRTAGPLSQWEQFLAQEGMRKYFKDPYQIIQAHEHLAFCKFWRRLNADLSASEFALLKDWLIRESERSVFSAAGLDAVNCKCLSLVKQ